MNVVVCVGRVVRDPEIRYTQEGLAIARWTLALQNKQRKDDGSYGADFPSFNAFGKTAEFVEKYIKKGTKICVRGHLKTGSYKDKDGKTIYTTDVVADEIEFAESKNAESTPASDDGFMDIPDGFDEELPFH